MTSNDEMEKERERYHHFYKWWSSHENKELRKSCATGWAFHIWNAALKSKQGEV